LKNQRIGFNGIDDDDDDDDDVEKGEAFFLKFRFWAHEDLHLQGGICSSAAVQLSFYRYSLYSLFTIQL